MCAVVIYVSLARSYEADSNDYSQLYSTQVAQLSVHSIGSRG